MAFRRHCHDSHILTDSMACTLRPGNDGAERVRTTTMSAQAPLFAVFIVPGWNKTAESYVQLSEALVAAGGVVTTIDTPCGARFRGTSDLHYRRLGAHLADFSRTAGVLPQTILAESLGATYLMACHPSALGGRQAVLLSPGVRPSTRQTLSRDGLRDAVRFIVTGRLPLLGWRLLQSSEDEAIAEQVRRQPGICAHSGYSFVLRSMVMGFRLLFTRRIAEAPRCWLVTGSNDRIVSQEAYVSIHRKLPGSQLIRMPGAPHNLLQSRNSAEVVDWIVSVCDPTATEPVMPGFSPS